MAKQSQSEQLDQMVQAIIARPGSGLPRADSKLAPLLRIAADLRDLPSEAFKARLRDDLKRRAAMSTAGVKPVREGFRSITPYVIVPGAPQFIEFLKQAFGANEAFRAKRPDGAIMHAEVRIDDSMLELADTTPQFKARPATILLTVKDSDAVYQSALRAGASSTHEPVTQPYGDREAGVKDIFGNHWYLSTRRVAEHTPADLPTVTPALQPQGAAQFIDFLKAAFGAEEAFRVDSPEGAVLHAKIKIGNSYLAIGEAHGEFQPMPYALHLYVPDVDAVYKRALQAGATSSQEPADQPYGDRSAGVVDPFGNQWFIATHIRDVPL